MPAGTGSSDSTRNSQRFGLPGGVVHVAAELDLLAVTMSPPLVGRLWDISRFGACVAFVGSRQIVMPASGVLLLKDPMSAARHRLQVNVRWSTPLGHTTFVGLRFTDKRLPRESFLTQFMRRSWTDSVPRSNLEI